MKRCFVCEEEKPLESFRKGLRLCRKCENLQHTQRAKGLPVTEFGPAEADRRKRGVRICRTCNEEKPVTAFRDNRTQCRKCHSRITLEKAAPRSKELLAYKTMKARCLNSRTRWYHRYGGRGITVCERWQFGEGGKTGFQCFLEDMGPAPSPEHSLDRINNDGHYEPSNCRWATPLEQASNKENRLRYRGKLLKQWAEARGLNYATVVTRFKSGLRGEALLRKPEEGR